MQNNSLVKIFGFLFLIVSVYQLSFTFISTNLEGNAKDYAIFKISEEEEDFISKRENLESQYLDSIGNISIYKLAEKHGVEFDAYKSGPYKDILSMWRPSTKEEEKLLQSVVDDVFSQFQKAFVESRKITQEQADKLAQGQIYSGLQALENNLIDKIGGYNDALQYIGELTGLGKNPAIISTYTNNWRDMVSILNNTFNMTLRNPIQTQIEVR